MYPETIFRIAQALINYKLPEYPKRTGFSGHRWSGLSANCETLQLPNPKLILNSQ